MKKKTYISSNIMKTQRNMISQKQNDNTPAREFKGMEHCSLTNEEFKIAVMKKFNEPEETSERQFNILRNKN